MCACTYMCLCVHVHARVYVRIHVYACVYAHTRVFAHMRIHVCLCVFFVCVYVYVSVPHAAVQKHPWFSNMMRSPRAWSEQMPSPHLEYRVHVPIPGGQDSAWHVGEHSEC